MFPFYLPKLFLCGYANAFVCQLFLLKVVNYKNDVKIMTHIIGSMTYPKDMLKNTFLL